MPTYTTHELMIKTNHHLIKGGELTALHKANITRWLLSARGDGRKRPRFMEDEGNMYPLYFIPPYNDGKKFQTVIPMSPKTHILAANSYELEIIRLLHMFAQDDGDVREMVKGTLNRLKRTCFGYERCYTGECFEAGVVVLRFLSAVAPDEEGWIKKQISVFNGHYADRRRPGGVLRYYWLCLSELPLGIAEPEILLHRDNIIGQLNRKPGGGADMDSHLVLENLMRNTLAWVNLNFDAIEKSEPALESYEIILHSEF